MNAKIFDKDAMYVARHRWNDLYLVSPNWPGTWSEKLQEAKTFSGSQAEALQEALSSIGCELHRVELVTSIRLAE